jgi:hypothetical protein
MAEIKGKLKYLQVTLRYPKTRTHTNLLSDLLLYSYRGFMCDTSSVLSILALSLPLCKSPLPLISSLTRSSLIPKLSKGRH